MVSGSQLNLEDLTGIVDQYYTYCTENSYSMAEEPGSQSIGTNLYFDGSVLKTNTSLTASSYFRFKVTISYPNSLSY